MPLKETKHPFTYVNGLGFLPETKQQQEKKHLILQYNVIWVSVLVLFFLRSVSMTPILRLLSMLGMNITFNPMTELVLSSEIAQQVATMIYTMVCFLLPIFVLYLSNRKTMRVAAMFSAPKSGTIRFTVPVMLGISIFVLYVVDNFVELLQEGGISFVSNSSMPPEDFASFVLYLVNNLLLPVLFYELLCRGMIQELLRPFGVFPAIVMSSLVFALLQTDLQSVLFALLIGFPLGYFTYYAKSILPAIACHFAIRWFLEIQLWFGYFFEFAHKELAFLLMELICVLVAAIVLIVKFRNGFYLLHGKPEETHLTTRTKLKLIFTNIGLWMTVVLLLVRLFSILQMVD